MSRKVRVAIVNSHPVQYFAPFYTHIARAGDIDLTVLYLSDSSVRGARDAGFGQTVKWDVDLLSGYNYRFVGKKARQITPGGFWSLATSELWGEIRRGKYDAILVHGHAYAANFVAIGAAKMFGTAVLMRGETHLGLSRTALKVRSRSILLKYLYRHCDAMLAIGSANREFYRSFGVPDEKISLVPYAVDNERFMRDSRLDPPARNVIRAELGVDDNTPIVLYASKLQRRKHPDAVVRALQRLERDGVALALVVVGAGEMEAELKAAVLARGPRTVFTGFVNQSRLPRILGACDVFVLPSEEEPWGLIVNEAMCAGLPVVVGDKLGCVPDLVRSGQNGFIVRAGDSDGIATALRPILTNADTRCAMSERSRAIIRDWGYAEGLDGWRQALEGIARRRKTVTTGRLGSPR